VCSYSIKALMTSTLIIITTSNGNNTNLNMKKAIAWYLSSPNFPLSFFYLQHGFNKLPLIPLVVLYWLILSKCSNLETSVVLSPILFLK